MDGDGVSDDTETGLDWAPTQAEFERDWLLAEATDEVRARFFALRNATDPRGLRFAAYERESDEPAPGQDG
jgi:hypothetical protein